MGIGRMAVAEVALRASAAAGRARPSSAPARYFCAPAILTRTDGAALLTFPTIIASAIRSRMTEGNQTLEVFVGTSRGELNAAQRAEVAQFGHRWRREVPAASPSNFRSAPATSARRRDTVRTIRSILAATSVPPNGIVVRGYQRPRTVYRADSHQLSADRGPGGTLRPLA